MFNRKINEAAQQYARTQQTVTSVGKVLKANESGNCCDIELKNAYGKSVILYSVVYQINDPKIASYFPSRGDYVYVQCVNNQSYLITGPYFKNSGLTKNGAYQTQLNKMYCYDYNSLEGNIL